MLSQIISYQDVMLLVVVLLGVFSHSASGGNVIQLHQNIGKLNDINVSFSNDLSVLKTSKRLTLLLKPIFPHHLFMKTLNILAL